MKKIHFFLILFLIPSLIYGLNKEECTNIRNRAIAEWNRHNELVKEFNNFGADREGYGLHRLRESLNCCQRALSLLDTILNDIAGKSKKKRKEPWRVEMKKASEKDKKSINDEIAELQKGINNVLSSMAFEKAKILYEESLRVAQEASNKQKECPTRTLSNVDVSVSVLKEAAKLYREAESLVKEAYTTLTSAPSYNEANKIALEQTIENFKQTAISTEKEAVEWPGKAIEQKISLKERLETLTEDSRLFAEKDLSRSSYELEKQALPILETLIQNSEGEEKEGFEKRLEALKTSIALFEEAADQNRFTKAIVSLSPEEFKLQEEGRRESFFKRGFALDPRLFFQTFIYSTSRPSVIPLDGQIGKSQKDYILYLDQFYRFYLQSDNPISKLIVKVYKGQDLVHEEEISLPVKNTHSWRSYLLTNGLIFIPETKLEREFGLDLRLKFVNDPRCHTSLMLSQKASDPTYRFAYFLDDGLSLFSCDLLGPPPWQLDALRKPSTQTSNRFSCKNNYSFDCDSKSLPNMQLGENFSLLDEFVETHKKDPLALAVYVQNEIALVDYYCYQEEGVFQSPGIQRNALRVYLEGQGSAWEQCQLLVYFLRRAGYQAFYAMGKPCSLPKGFIENMLFTRLPEGQEEGLLQYPWVVFFDGERWISLFPWMKEIQMSEGFDVYQFLPEEFASADRWILRYLKGDERILKHIGSDGDESAGRLFVAFVEEHLRKQGLSLDDVGIHRTQIKRQFASFADFPSPKIEGPFNILDLDKSSPLFAKADIEIFSRENPNKKLHARISLISITSEAIPLHFEGNRLCVHFIGEEKERYLDLDKTDRSIDIKVTPELLVGTRILNVTGSVSLEKGGNAALCFHFGGRAPKITALHFDQFNREKEEAKRLQLLLSFLGAAYFEKCGTAQEFLAKLHKVHPTSDFAFGLAKLIERGTNESKEKLPQVDMIGINRPLPFREGFTFWQQEIFSALRQFKTLSIVDSSSNEHQILRDIFSDTSAISTVKLLQLAHRYQCKEGLSEEGFLALHAEMLKEAEEDPEVSQSLYFSHLNDLNLRDLKTTSQWKAAKTLFDQDSPFNAFAYVYMTPGCVYSPDGTYKEMGTFIFHPERGSALISSGSLSLNGGLGSPLPDYYFNPSMIPKWQLTPNYNGYMNSYKLEVPSRFDTSIPSIQPTILSEKTRWEPDVRIEHKSIWNHVADPVDIVTGSFYIDETDLVLPGFFPLEIRRNYNSQNPLMGELGAGWKLSLNPFLVEQEGQLYAAEADGTIICYSYNSATSRWEVFPEDNPDLCNFNQKGIGSVASPFHAYIENDVLYGSDGSKRFFKDGLLRKWVNARGIALTFIYKDDRLVRIESSYGEFLGLEYNYEGKISEINAKDGRRISYSYNSQGDLVKVTLPNTATITYEYDKAHRLFRETKPLGQVLENVYDEQGRVTEQRSPMGPRQEMVVTATFEYGDDITIVTDAAGGKTIYKIFQKQIYKIIDPLGAETLQSWFIDEELWFDAGAETVQAWDKAGGAVRSLKSTTDKRGLTTTYLYDDRGNPIQVKLTGEDLTGDGQTTALKKLKFNDSNLCIQEEVLEQKTITTYDKTFPYLPKRIEKYSGNHFLSYIDLEYNAQGLLEKENNNGAITRWQYDARGFPIQKTEETGTENPDVVTEYAYNHQGQCIKIVTEDATETNVYDIMGNLIEAHVVSPAGELLSASYFGYNLNNQPIWQQTANAQNTTYFDYHSSGQIKAKRQQLAPSKRIAYTLFEYDPRGYLIEEVDPLGYTTYREYDPLGNVLSETKEGHTTQFSYEVGGFVETITTPSGAKTTRLYTTNGLLKEEIYPDGTKASIIYDLFSRPILETKNGITWEIQYDDINAQVTRKHVDTGETEVRKYDARGNLIAFTDRAGFTWEKTYDSLNRVKTEVTPEEQETTYDYVFNMVMCNLPNGEITTTTYEGGRVRDYVTHNAQNHQLSSGFYAYDTEGDIQKSIQGDTQVTFTWINALGKPMKIQKGSIIETFEYDASGNCVAITNGKGQTTHQTFDGLGRVIQKELPDGGLLKFDYDLDSNLAKVRFPNGNIWKASYDCMGRKISERLYSGRESTQEWEYTYVEGYLRQTKDPMGRMREYEYDSHGRLLQEKVDGWQRIYTYDPRGFLLSLTQIGSQSISWVSSWFYTPREEHSIVERSYDADGHLTYESISLNSELIQETHQEWEPGMRHLRIGNHERTFVYQNNRLAEVTSGRTCLTYTYDRSGALKSKISPLTRTAMHYNFAGLPEIVQMHLPTCNIEETLKWNPSGKLAAYSSPALQKQFTYTPCGYLQTAGAETYEFDFGNIGTGARTAAPSWQVPQHGLDAFGRVVAEIMDKFSWATNYDVMGQVISQGQRQYEWDPWGRLLKVTAPSFSWEASYDAFGRRLQTRHTPANSSTTITTTSFYDPEEEFQEIGIQLGDKTYWKLYGPDSCDAVIDETGASVFLMHNALNELIVIVSEQDSQYTPRICSSYGPQTQPSIPSDLLIFAQSLSWHSKSLDPTGLILMGKRYYDPKAGRFISPDPVGYPLCMDLYAYAGGDPVNYFDPDGRFASNVYQISKPKIIAGLDHLTGYSQTVGTFNRLSAFCYDHNLTRSESFQVGSFDLPNGAIGFVNGIANAKEESMAKARYLSQYAGGANIYGVYNASNSVIGDLIDCGLGRFGIMTPPTHEIKDRWHDFFAISGPGAKFFQPCHSHGATHVKNALLTSPEEVRQRIIVLAIAPSEIVPRKLCFQSYNYVSRRDFVTHLDLVGKMRYGDELIILEPHSDAKFFDHDFLSPTFKKPIERHIKEYIELYGGVQ